VGPDDRQERRCKLKVFFPQKFDLADLMHQVRAALMASSIEAFCDAVTACETLLFAAYFDSALDYDQKVQVTDKRTGTLYRLNCRCMPLADHDCAVVCTVRENQNTARGRYSLSTGLAYLRKQLAGAEFVVGQ
jgi:hypothetical protein